MALRSSLNRQLSWTSVLTMLGAARDDVAHLPARATCPTCHSARKLHVMQDALLGGEWYRCAACGFAGDSIELAASAWKVTTRLAIRRLFEDQAQDDSDGLTFDQRIDRYLRGVLGVRQKVLAFWDSCRIAEPTVEDADTETVLRSMGVPASREPSTWKERGGRYIGYSTRAEVDAFFMPTTARTKQLSARGRKELTQFGGKIFVGASWRGLVVVPYSDLPGRIGGFLFVGRRAEPQDRVYKRIVYGPGAIATGVHVAMLETANCGGPLLVVPEIGHALYLQLRRVSDGSPPLPLVSPLLAVSAREQSWPPWPVGTPRRRVVWDPEDSVRAVITAGQCDAAIATCDQGTKDTRAFLRSSPPDIQHGRLCLSPDSRLSVVVRLAEEAPEAVEELAAAGALKRDELADLAATSGGEQASFFTELAEGPSLVKHSRIDGVTFREESGRWYAGSNQLCDFVIRIDRVIYQASKSRGIYEGRILFGDRTVSFLTPAAEVEAAPLEWARDLLWAAGAGAPTISRRYSKQIIQLSLAMHRPSCIVGAEGVGWNSERGQFVFPRFTLDGEAVLPADPLIAVADGPIPCLDFDQPDPPTEFEMRQLARPGEETALFWGVAACVAQSALASALGYPRQSVSLQGEGTALIGTSVARACGCVEPLGKRIDCRHQLALSALEDYQARHRWLSLVNLPVPVRITPGYSDRIAQLANYGDLIVPNTRIAAYALRLGYDWRTLRCRRRHGLTCPAVYPWGPRVIAAYIHDALRRNFQVRSKGLHRIRAWNIGADMAGWWKHIGGDPSALIRGLTSLSPARGAHGDALAGLLRALRTQGRITFRKAGGSLGTDDARKLIVPVDGNRLAIPARRLNLLLPQYGAPPLSYDAVASRLSADGVLLGEGQVNGEDCWHVSRNWLLSEWRQKNAAGSERRAKDA